ncbi:hypothetical protein HanRHA438_Chr01g0020031 [Helianthus annuus]|nr:hypothetical protein HanRHA438_Chr01g0020031 [Helianthus annuus]
MSSSPEESVAYGSVSVILTILWLNDVVLVVDGSSGGSGFLTNLLVRSTCSENFTGCTDTILTERIIIIEVRRGAIE